MEEGARYSVRDGGDVFGEEELGVKYEPEVTDLGGPVDSRVVKA